MRHRPVAAAHVGRWQAPEHRQRIVDQFTGHPDLFTLLRRDGYEADDAGSGALT